MKDIVMPKLGYDMTEGKLLRWLKKPGDAVARGETVAEIETDKVNTEVESFEAGILHSIAVQDGETVPVGQRIGLLALPGELDAPAPAAASAVQTSAVAEVGTGSSTSPASSGGTAVATRELPTLPVEQPADERAGTGHAAIRELAAAYQGAQTDDTATGDAQGIRVKASPLARRLAQEHEVDLTAIHGTGPGGRVTRDDVLAVAARATGSTPTGTSLTAPAAPPAALRVVPSPADVGEDRHAPAVVPTASPIGTSGTAGEDSGRVVALSRMQQTMARRMVESKAQAPHYYLTVQIDMTEALLLRAQLNAAGEDGTKVSVNDLVVKAVARALVSAPALNASFAGDHLVVHDEVSIAVAVAVDDGLVTPVIGQADGKSVGQISRETRALAERARTGKSRPQDYAGGTFTVSNLGMYGIDTFVAIINPPQSGILAVGSVRRVPTYVGDDLVPRDMMSVTLSGDHRASDGATGARFLADVRALLEHPLRLLL